MILLKKLAPYICAGFRFGFLLLSVLYMEILLKYWYFGVFLGENFSFTILFSVPICLALALLCSLFKKRTNKLIYNIILLVLGAYYMSQCVYYTVFNSILLLDKLEMATNAFANYWREALIGLIDSFTVVLGVYMPFIIFTVLCLLSVKKPAVSKFFKSSFKRVNKKYITYTLLFFALFQGLAISVTYASNSGILSPGAVYTSAWTPELSMANFGSLTTLRLNFQQILFDGGRNAQSVLAQSGIESEDDSSADNSEATQPVPQEITYEANITDIDFDALIAEQTNEDIIELHEYFSEKQPTLKNEYTGLFEGKNLIFITAEGFWNYAVNEEYTPTLYKLANEGFVFDNFYTPLWWTSTSDGEFVATNGLYPLNYTQAFQEVSDNYTPYTMGNILSEQGYETTAYHNHTYTYYSRHITHPNMGYEFYGLGNGLEVTPTWPESDLEMMELSLPQTLEGDMPFHNYYMTVSGHLYYTFDGNAMSTKHMQAVEDLNMSEEAKAYIACQIELDKALEYMLNELEKAGELENTVICLSSDHHPYGLSEETMDEFYGGSMDKNFEMYKNTLILYSADMSESVHIEKAAASVDILPTLLNLFGIEYDSRLLMGSDLLSTAPGLVIFSNKSFITDEGSYNSLTDTFLPNANSSADDSYALEIFNETQLIAQMSEGVIMNDYYRHLFLANEE